MMGVMLWMWLAIFAYDFALVCAEDWGLSIEGSVRFIEEVNLFVCRINDLWPIPDMVTHFMPQLVCMVGGLMMIGASPARCLSSSAQEVLIILRQLGMVYAAVEVDGVLTSCTITSWVLPVLADEHMNALFARMSSSFARLDAHLAPAIACARAQQDGGGLPLSAEGVVQDPIFADLGDINALRAAPAGLPAPSALPAAGDGVASGEGKRFSLHSCSCYVAHFAREYINTTCIANAIAGLIPLTLSLVVFSRQPCSCDRAFLKCLARVKDFIFICRSERCARFFRIHAPPFASGLHAYPPFRFGIGSRCLRLLIKHASCM